MRFSILEPLAKDGAPFLQKAHHFACQLGAAEVTQCSRRRPGWRLMRRPDMQTWSAWNIDAWQILTRRELAAVLADLKVRAWRLPSVQMNLVIVRLACCCGLRAREIAGLLLAEVRLESARPHIQVRAESAKLHRAWRVPLWWDAGTLEDLAAWKRWREANRATRNNPFVCSLQRATWGRPLTRHVLRRRFQTACGVLGNERVRALTLHHGRHTFVSHSLAGERTLAEVRAAAGHASLQTTSIYLHVAVDGHVSWSAVRVGVELRRLPLGTEVQYVCQCTMCNAIIRPRGSEIWITTWSAHVARGCG
jgi:Phage integrase family